MRILLIGNFAPDRQESMLRYGKLLSTGLRNAGHHVDIWSPEPRLVRALPHYRYSGAAKFVGYFDKFVLFPRTVRHQLRDRRPDIVHILDHANSVYAPLFAGRPLVATCHDLLQIQAARGEFPQHRVSSLGRRYQSWILGHIGRLPHVITPSTRTSLDLRRLTGLGPNQVTVIPNGLNYPYRPAAPAAARLVIARMLKDRGIDSNKLLAGGGGFLLNVGGGQWYKNRTGLLEIYAEVRRHVIPVPKLVMVGKPLSAELASRVTHLGLTDDLVVLTGVSEAQLQALYSQAKALVFPSWFEGFGWPVAEAQACGCPVFTSNRAPMTEVGGDGAEYIDPADSQAAGVRIAHSWPYLDQLAERGRLRSAEWRQDLMIERYVATYERLASTQSHSIAA
jgi:glycosyltransferase involved in cell wall biosynthesis